MEETKTLDYFRDKDDNYIIRRIWSNEEENNYFLCSGTYSSIFIFKKNNLDREVEKTFEMIADNIEKDIMKKYKVEKNSFLFEKIIGNFVTEEKYNPLFSKMSDREVSKFQGDSIKVRINMAFETHIKVEKHLKFKALMETILGKTRT